MPYHPQRYSKVFWLEPKDLEPYGIPEMTIHRGSEIAHYLRILSPFEDGSDQHLMVTADERTRVIALAIREDAGGD